MDIKLPNNVLIITLAFIIVCDAMRDLVLFVQFKNREKHPWRSVTFSKGCRLKAFIFTKSNILPRVFFTF